MHSHERLLVLTRIAEEAVFELHGSQSMPGPLTSYDGPLTLQKIPATEGAAVPSLLCTTRKASDLQVCLKYRILFL